jgi:peptide/nickel transport system substrate-binding protein
MKSERYVPITLRDTVSASEASNRYDASIKWITQHNNAIIGNGPFYLDSYNPSGGLITIKAFRDSSYPSSVGYWNKYEHPKLAACCKQYSKDYSYSSKDYSYRSTVQYNSKCRCRWKTK